MTTNQESDTLVPVAGGRGLPMTRLEAFSDGVFAIAITLLVLEIAIPLGAEEDLLGALVGQWPSYLAYVISYLTIGWVWIGHSATTSHVERADGIFLRLNLLLLMGVAFLPFPTKIMAEYLGNSEPERVAVVFYGIVLLVIALLLDVLWRYAVRSRELLRSDLSDDELAGLTRKSTASLGMFLGSIVLGVFLPTFAVFAYLIASAYLVIPFRTIRQAIARRGD
ncbi:MAG: TMEM175 family protein [Chloroflexi bacterium]|jgi:uncharacterized membrane protein|nr:TMEM175 family protein [Chloroflexota bacterium]